MNEKTMNQIEAMKKQTIGVEVEMNNITRKTAAKLVAEYFCTGRYQDTASCNGYSTWSAWDSQNREWKFQMDSSIHGPSDEQCEMVSPILTYEDIPTLQEVVRILRKAGAKSSPSRGCGVHIHIGLGDHTPQTLRNLVNMMASHENQLAKAIKLDEERQLHYCKMVDQNFLREVNRKKPSTMQELANIWYTSQGCDYGRSHHYNQSRYHMLNLHASFTKGTIEFRLFQFSEPSNGRQNGLHAGELKTYIQLCLALSQLAKQLRSVSPRPQQTENEKYAFRCFLLRLGFVGDEFKTARGILLKNMDGNGAWRRIAV